MQQWTTVDKSSWKFGQDEPDKVQWKDEATGFDCLIVRNFAGALCGYVGVHAGHPAHGVHYYDLSFRSEVHGGLTFSGGWQHSEDPAKGICHIPAEGEVDDIWWLGFDCAHCFDICPGRESVIAPYPESEYRDLEYVKSEVRNLASQLTITSLEVLEQER